VVVNAFVQSLQKRYRSPYTIKCYKYDLEDFERFCERQGITHPVSPMLGASGEHVKAFIERPDLKESTQARKLTSIRTFYRWAASEYSIENSTTTVKTPKFIPTKRSCLTPTDVAKLFENIKGDNVLLTSRDKAICSLIVNCGMRVNEIESLDVEDLDLDNGRVRVNTFGKPERWMNVSAAIPHLIDYLQTRNEACGHDPLFVNKHNGRLNPRSIRRKVGKYAEMAGINANPRNLRHTYVKGRLDAGDDVNELTSHLGQQLTPSLSVYEVEQCTRRESGGCHGSKDQQE